MQHAPKWALPAGVALCGVAGWTNAVGFLGVFHQAITHVTGTATMAAVAAAHGDLAATIAAGSIIGSCVGGAVIAGALVHGGEVHQGRRYGLALLLEALLLTLAWRLLSAGHSLGEYIAAIAAGLQNGLATRVSGAVVRTTHITGLVTDIGLTIGAVVRGRALDTPRFRLQTLLVGGFLVGGFGGALHFGVVGTNTLLVPAAACIVLAIAAATVPRPPPPPG